jgi:hypothetical protein
MGFHAIPRIPILELLCVKELEIFRFSEFSTIAIELTLPFTLVKSKWGHNLNSLVFPFTPVVLFSVGFCPVVHPFPHPLPPERKKDILPTFY